MSYDTLGHSAFKAAERQFKACATVNDAIDLLNCIDFAIHDASNCESIQRSTEETVLNRKCTVHTLVSHDGLFILKNALSVQQQMELAYCALNESLSPPNRTNLHCHYDENEIAEKLQNIWSRDGPELDDFCASDGISNGTTNEQRKRKKGDLYEGPRLPCHLTLSKVRWATLGYQYDWTARSYHKEQFVPFPEQLGDFSRLLAEACEHGFTMQPQAGIVNFYPVGQVMGGHVDDGEEAHECPVVSYSLGPPCIFLVGGVTKEVTPTPILLRSGDVLVLGGASRLKFHGIPKVFVAHGVPEHLQVDTASQHSLHKSSCPHFLSLRTDVFASECTCGGVSVIEAERTLKVLACARVNVNLRQVYRESSDAADGGGATDAAI